MAEGELVKHRGVVHRVGVLVKGERGVGGEIDGPMGRVGWGARLRPLSRMWRT